MLFELLIGPRFSAQLGRLHRHLQCNLQRRLVRPGQGLSQRLLVPALLTLSFSSAQAGVGPTVKDVIEMTRIVQPVNHDDTALQKQISPDRQQAFIVIRKPDVATDVNRFELLRLDLSGKRLESGAFVKPISLLTVDARHDNDEYDPPLREARWIDDRTLVFRARLNDQPFQVYRLDVPTRRLTQLTYAPDGLVAFDTSQDLRRVVYVAPVLSPAVPPGARSIVVGTHSFWNVHFGHLGVRNQQRRYQYMVTEAGSRLPARSLGASFPESSMGTPSASVSPDGRWAVLPRFEPQRQDAWAKQYPLLGEANTQHAASRALDPLSYFSRPLSYVARRMALFRLEDGQEQVMLDAPDDSFQGNRRRTDRLWLDGGRSVVLAGTFLPRPSQPSAPGSATSSTSTDSHIIEYWPDQGRWKVITALKRRLKDMRALQGPSASFVAVDGETPRQFERGAGGAWQEVAAGAVDRSKAAGSAKADATLADGGLRLKIQESLNVPPDLFVTGRGGEPVRLTELNPQFSPASWGAMTLFDWNDAKGRTWRGGLMTPAGFDPKRRYPLVIQTYGFSPTRFYRDGSNTYDGFTSGFPGRAFMREGVLVLAIPSFPPDAGIVSHRDKMVVIQDGVRAAIDALDKAGTVDRGRVGIMGWSATGEQVLNMVTFTDIPIRAASMLDGDSNSLFSMTITYAVLDGIQVRKEEVNGGGPYGRSRQAWLDSDPSLHTECIKAAMRIETYGHEVHNHWDLYALMRRQYKPVEMIFIPEGSHGLSRPSERMISLQGNVDWHSYWLAGVKRSEPLIPGETNASLMDQYVRWDQMQELKRLDDARPACVRSGRLG